MVFFALAWALYIYIRSRSSQGAAMFSTVAQTGQTKHLLSFHDNWKLQQVLLCLEGEGEGYSAATCNFTTRCHLILNTEPLNHNTRPKQTVRHEPTCLFRPDPELSAVKMPMYVSTTLKNVFNSPLGQSISLTHPQHKPLTVKNKTE